MVAPILATTGINTKLLVALELGVPLIVTSAAAAPLGLNASAADDGKPALIADSAAEFVAAVARLTGSNIAWRASSHAAVEAFHSMELSDPAAADMRALLRAVHITKEQRKAASTASMVEHASGGGGGGGGGGGIRAVAPSGAGGVASHASVAELCAVIDRTAAGVGACPAP